MDSHLKSDIGIIPRGLPSFVWNAWDLVPDDPEMLLLLPAASLLAWRIGEAWLKVVRPRAHPRTYTPLYGLLPFHLQPFSNCPPTPKLNSAVPHSNFSSRHGLDRLVRLITSLVRSTEYYWKSVGPECVVSLVPKPPKAPYLLNLMLGPVHHVNHYSVLLTLLLTPDS